MKIFKRIRRYNVFLSIVLSLCIVLTTRVQFSNIWGTIEENYFTKFGMSAIVLFILTFCFILIGIHLTDAMIKNFFEKFSCQEQEPNRKKIIGIWAMVIFIAWIPYYLSYYPGGIYSDTFFSIRYIMSDTLTNRHPFFYTLLIGLSMKLGTMLNKGLTWSIGFFTMMQMLILECEFLYFVSWMLCHKLNRFVRVGSSIFFVFFPLIPLYAVSVWKDTPFCMAVLFWMMSVVDLYFEIVNNKYNVRNLVRFSVGIILVAFTRNNGIYIVMLSVFVMLTIIICKSQKERLSYIIAGGGILITVIIYLIQGPGYSFAGIEQTETVENFGIPLQQIGAVVAYDGFITEEQRLEIDNFIPFDNIKEHYAPTLADELKWYAGLEEEYLSANPKDFLKLWLGLFRQNPSICLKAYLMSTVGFWNIDVATNDAYVQNFVWSNDLGVEMHDYFIEWFGFSFQHFANPRHMISCAWFFWIFFIMAWFSMKHYGNNTIFLFIPQLGIWITLMIATPIAVSLRYIAANMFTLPFAVIVPLLLEERKGLGSKMTL